MRVTFLLVIIAAAVFASLVHREKGNPPPRAEKSMEAEDAPEPHFYADVDVNGATLHMLVDTGASAIALSREDARSAGIATSIGMPDVIGRGADGDVHGEVATLDRVSLGEKTAEGLPAVILNSGEQSLLGQSFLSKFDRVEIEGDKMLLQ
jgi:aspartyl protease family protein